MKPTVLVADDSLTIRKFVTLTFENETVDVLSAGDGSEALERAMSVRPDVVLADVCMPGLNGYELCERIKRSPELHDTSVVLLVGMFEPFDADEALRVRSDGHLSKPLDPAELLTTVHALLRNRQPRRGTGGDTQVQRPPRVSERMLESFTRGGRILDIISLSSRGDWAPSPRVGVVPRYTPLQSGSTQDPNPPEDLLASKVDEAVRRLAPAIIREVVEQLVPRLVRQSSGQPAGR